MKASLVAIGLLVWVGKLMAQTPLVIIDEVHRVTNGGGPFGIMRSFGVAAISCASESGREPVTIVDVLGSDVKTLSVRGYDTARFRTEDEVRNYVRVMLTARSEGERMSTFQAWSEGGGIQVVIVTEWTDGRFGRFDLGGLGIGGEGNQYAHLEDHRGCERWARFPNLGR